MIGEIYTWYFDLKGDHEEQGKQILEYLRTTDYGRCVFHSDKNQLDHFIMNMLFEDGTTATFSMECHTNYEGRRTRIMGTKGGIVGDMSNFTLTHWDGKVEKWDAGNISGGVHGGGDLRLIRDMVLAVYHNDPSLLTSSIDASMESHVMGFRGEVSRLKGGKIIKI